MHDILRGLNDAQREAVTTVEGPLLVLAGAGTGKTRVITVRMAWMLAQGIAPTNVLAMTFTNKAAGEMKARVAELVGAERAKLLTVGTFHGFCVRILREHAAEVGLSKTFAIADESDQLSALRGALRELSIAEARVQPSFAQSRISLAKNKLGTAEQMVANASDDREELIGRAWLRYEERLRRSNAVDFDDLLVLTVKLLAKKPVREMLAKRFAWLLVDEYQDTNAPQYEILKQIAGRHRNLCVVGDDDQSIYGWRGADVQKILGFEKDFKGAKIVRLETNYRSTKQILDAANTVIVNNPKRHAKELRSAFGEGDPLMMISAEDEMAEADAIVREIQGFVRLKKLEFRDIAILFRTGIQPRPFEAVLRSRNVPYVLIGGMSFFDRKEVRDVLAFAKLVANPSDEASFLRVINVPPRGIGKTTIERLLEVGTARALSVPELLDGGEPIEGVGEDALATLRDLRAGLKTLGLSASGRELVPTLSKLFELVNYRAEVERCYPDQAERDQRWTAVTEVLNFAENYARRAKKPTLAGFLEELALSAEDSDDKQEKSKSDAITLMTLHAAKGLEYPRVYLVGLEEGLLPHQRSVEEDTIEEERRLCYVGITRAKRNLTLSWARSRSKYGKRVDSQPSRFLFELKKEKPPKDWRPAERAKELPKQPPRREPPERGRRAPKTSKSG